jgi:hypothetical protein
MPLDLVLSPYDLTARSSAAVAACVLGDRVVTLMPGPGKNLPRDPAALARRGTPAFERLAEAWAWSGPLWRSGTVVAGMDGDGVAEAVRTARAGIERQPEMGVLASLMKRTDAGDDDSAKFDAICRDLVTGGINPSVTVPLGAAVESFAAAQSLTLVRGGTSSLMTRLEKASQRVVFRLSTACVTEGDASDIVALRESMLESSRGFRAGLSDLLHATRTGARQGEIAGAVGAADTARIDFEAALEDRVESLRRKASFSGQRMKVSRVTLTGSLAESDAGVRAARAAALALERGGTGKRVVALPSGGPASEPAPVESGLTRGPMVVLTIKAVGLNVRAGLALGE